MDDFKYFINRETRNRKLSFSSEIASVIPRQLSTASTISLSRSDRDKFSSEVAQLASSDEVMSELSDSLGKPRECETENEFVDRAKSLFTNILKRKLTK